jgi:hypothetical protein
MKAFQIRYLVTIAMLSLTTIVFCQNKIASIKVSFIKSAYIDRPGDLYIIDEHDSLAKFSIDGQFLAKYSMAVTIFDPRDGARWFVYEETPKKRFGFFSEDLGMLYPVREHYAIEPTMVCASGENQAWILDRADWSLKRVDPAQSRVVADALIDQKQFNQPPEFIFMREYQHFLFLIEKKNGIIIFNSLGHQIKKIVDSDIKTVNFLGEELYYKKGDKLIFYDFFDGTTREMPVDPACKFALLTDVRKYLVYPDKIEIFENR